MRFYETDQGLIPEFLFTGEGETVNRRFFQVKEIGIKAPEPKRIFDVEKIPVHPVNTSFSFNEDLQKLLAGRMLLLEEVPFSLETVHEHVLHGYIRYEKGIDWLNGTYACNRCGNRKRRLLGKFPCARCGQGCVYCRQCIMMGRISQCTPLIRWIGPEPNFSFSNALRWSGTLSVAQREAAEKISEAIKTKTDLLIWAVCGAGKTEMLFSGIEEALSSRMRVAIATPRTDVVLELAPRLQQAFPDVPVAALYGGSDDRYKFSMLTIATTHQLLRFKEAFDVMIIDEVDAFPYSADEMLQQAAEKARKKDSAQIFLTATPKEEWQRECFRGTRNHYILPARFHRYPLPIPRFVWCGNWRKALAKNTIPVPIRQWVQKRIDSGKQALVFFPHIELMEQSLPLFQRLHPDIASVHAEDPERKEKVQKMRNGTIPILLTTTILERGVTIPNIDVAVVGAEDDTFTESALVQIAGRVGRSPDYPTGDIAFFHFGKSRAMVRARLQLIRMNNEAWKRGLIDVRR